MKKALIALVSVIGIIAVAVSGLFVWEQQSKRALESQVEDYLDDRGVESTGVDVHGRPSILYALQGSVDLSYVDLVLQGGTNKDQLLVHRLGDGRADRLTRFVTFDHPAGDVDPLERADGSFTDSAMVDGQKVSYTAEVKDHRVQLLADGHRSAAIAVEQSVTAYGAVVTDTGVVVELEYSSSDGHVQ